MTSVRRAPELTALGGLPFLDDAFANRRLLAIIAAARHGTAQSQGLAGSLDRDQAEAWLAALPHRGHLAD